MKAEPRRRQGMRKDEDADMKAEVVAAETMKEVSRKPILRMRKAGWKPLRKPLWFHMTQTKVVKPGQASEEVRIIESDAERKRNYPRWE